jgi:hypothetical protein
VKKDGGNQAVFGSINSGEGGTKKSQGNKGGAVKVNCPECESGQPLGLGYGEATGQPREKSSTKKNLLPDRGDHQSISEKGSEGFGIPGFEESCHGWLGLEREAEQEIKTRTKKKEGQDGKKKGQHGLQGETEISQEILAEESPKNGRFLAAEGGENESDRQGSSREKGGGQPGAESKNQCPGQHHGEMHF